MSTRRRRDVTSDPPPADRLTLDDAPAATPRHSGAELDADIAAKEAELAELYREKAFVPFPTMLHRAADAPLTRTPLPGEPDPAVESVTVYSEAGVAAAEAEGYTEDYASIVDPPPPVDGEGEGDGAPARAAEPGYGHAGD